ncbi:apolipoprotein A-II-like [Elgaria multicarinata webbii]|uniref:apolipoprotein A-II-like n=1 Tax=Elgaria multicarinata webbii TaxID=159646 RepID=UPI002FCCE5E6
MKVFALAILLVSVCCLEGALVKRQAEEGQSQAQPLTVEETFQQLSDKFTEYISPERFNTLRTQAQTHIQELHDTLNSAADSLKAFLQHWANMDKKPPQ